METNSEQEPYRIFLFTGQGNQTQDMFMPWYGYSEETDEILQTLHEVTETEYGKPIPEKLLENGPVMQPANVTIGILGFVALREQGIEPDEVIGHSLGEVTASTAVSALDSVNAIKLSRQRGIDTASVIEKLRIFGIETGMVSLASRAGHNIAEIVREELGGFHDGKDTNAANYNSPGQTVVSGIKKHLQAISARAGKGLKARMLPVDGPYHSKLMMSAKKRLKKTIEMLPIENPVKDVTFTSPTVCGPLETSSEISSMYADQLVGSVRFSETILQRIPSWIKISKSRPIQFIEIGAHPIKIYNYNSGVLLGLIRDNAKHPGLGEDFDYQSYRLSVPNNLIQFLVESGLQNPKDINNSHLEEIDIRG